LNRDQLPTRVEARSIERRFVRGTASARIGDSSVDRGPALPGVGAPGGNCPVDLARQPAVAEMREVVRAAEVRLDERGSLSADGAAKAVEPPPADAPVIVRAVDEGFDCGSAAIGAGALVVLISLGGFAYISRGRIHVAR